MFESLRPLADPVEDRRQWTLVDTILGRTQARNCQLRAVPRLPEFMFAEPSEEELFMAIHEASHGIAWLCLGYELLSLDLFMRYPDIGGTMKPADHGGASVTDQVTLNVAGRQGEIAHAPSRAFREASDSDRTDRAQARRLLATAHGVDIYHQLVDAELERCEARAAAIVSANFRWIERTARQLLVARHLTGAQVVALRET